jgi:cytochrome c-type biogenesis protein CcmE
MNKQRQGKLIKIAGMLVAVAISATFILYALRQNISLYYTPSQLLNTPLSKNEIIRIGGRVVVNSVHYVAHSTKVDFAISDSKNKLLIEYNGILPALFRVGQTVVVQGYLSSNGLFRADQVLAKHGANYHAP